MFESPDTTVLTAARAYVARGWNPVPVGFREKKLIGDGWQHRRIDANNAAQYFNCGPMNVGVQLGRASGGLVDVDLDCAEALYLVDAFLPPTASIFGRASKPRSHRLYRSDLCERIDDAALQFKDPEAKGMLVELRIGGGTLGAQTVFPGSTHKDTGELIEWVNDSEQTAINGDFLSRQVARLAAAALMARQWGEGSRHALGFTLGGFLCRAGWSEPEVAHFTEAVSKCAGDDDWQDRVKPARDQFEHHKKPGRAKACPV